MVRQTFWILFLPLLLLSSCGKKSHSGLRIAIDPSWYPLQIPGKEEYVFGFCNDLIQEIAKNEDLDLQRVVVNWDHILYGLKHDQYEAAISTMPPLVFNQKDYDFSGLLLKTGPVLIVNNDSSSTSLQDLRKATIMIAEEQAQKELVRPYQEMSVLTYERAPEALNRLVERRIDGVLMESIVAYAYVQDIYAKNLKVAGPPLNNEGLRLITNKGEYQKFLASFNRGLKDLKERGEYERLLAKWKLTP